MKVKVHIVHEQAAAGGGPDFGALVPNPTTVAAIEAARRGEVVELGTPEETIAELNRDDRGPVSLSSSSFRREFLPC